MEYVCGICSYTDDVLPKKCPNCGASEEKFEARTKPEREDENLEDDMER